MSVSTNQILERTQLSLLLEKPFLITDYEDQIPEDLKRKIINAQPKYIRFLKSPSEELQYIALAGQSIIDFVSSYIHNPCDNVLKTCLNFDDIGTVIYVKNIPEYLLEEHIKNKKPTIIDFIRHPSDKLQLLSLENHWTSEWYKTIMYKFYRDNEKEFQKYVNKLKLTKGPLE